MWPSADEVEEKPAALSESDAKCRRRIQADQAVKTAHENISHEETNSTAGRQISTAAVCYHQLVFTQF